MTAPTAVERSSASGSSVARGVDRRPVRTALLLVVAYLALGLAWAFSNPPGAAPDETDHLIKALAAGRLEVGAPYEGLPRPDDPRGRRNASISRDVELPARLAPDGYACTAFNPEVTADCLPDIPRTGGGTVVRTTAVGAYPIFGYVPLGLAARAADDPTGAFLAARLVSLLMSSLWLLAGAWHLARWLGRWAMIGVVIAFTPMAVFTTAVVSTSGLEISSATALAAVAVVATRCPQSLADQRTIAVATASACALVLSRQLGVVTLIVLGTLVLARGGAQVLWHGLLRRRRAMIAAALAIVASSLAVLAWEVNFDHPSGTGTPFSGGAVRTFLDLGYHYVHSGIGKFGWLDTPLPGIGVATWLAVVSLVVGAALVTGRRADRWSVGAALAATVVVAYATHATVFYPVGFGLQGRHMLPLFAVAPMLAAVVVAERLVDVGMFGATRRLYRVVGVSMAGLQMLGIVVNARRYAVGLNGPINFLGDAEWAPAIGWVPWLLLAGTASTWLGVFMARSTPPFAPIDTGVGTTDVER